MRKGRQAKIFNHGHDPFHSIMYCCIFFLAQKRYQAKLEDAVKHEAKIVGMRQSMEDAELQVGSESQCYHRVCRLKL